MDERLKSLKTFFESSSTEYRTSPLKFGITIASFERKNGKSPEYLTRCLRSILNQTATNWKVYLVGDKYENNVEFEATINSIFHTNQDKIQYTNLPEPGERGKILNNKVMWMVGGSTAFNTAIQMSIDDGCDYILHLDDDDWFHEKKIQVLNYACSQFSNPDYLFHYSTYKHRDRFPPDNIQKFELDNFHPRPAGLIHSTMCCHKSIMENFRYNNKIHQCGDIQLIQHAQHLKKTKNISILFIPLVLGYHPIEGESR